MSRLFSTPRAACWLILAGALAACGSGPAPSSRPAPARPSRVARVADANTVAILLATSNVDLAYARVADSRRVHRDVKAFAKRMTTDHTKLNETLTRLIKRLDITPREDDVTRLLREQSNARRDTLRTFDGREFDSAYVANEVRYHQEILTAIDRVFLPSAQNPALRDYVTTLRPVITAHLAHAERLQSTLAALAQK
jgi:putative membrane protein